MRKRFLLFLTFLVVCWLATSLACMQVPPHVFWPAGFVALSMPFALGFNILLILLWLWYKPVFALLPLLVLFFFRKQYERLIAFNITNKQETVADEKIQVLSYNVRVFNLYSHLRDSDYRSSKDMINWIGETTAGIICLQEFYRENDSDIFNTVSRIGTRYNRNWYVAPSTVNKVGAEFGLAIFSKYPIVNKGKITFKGETNNQSVYADVLIGTDTVRVYNFHLQSMSIEENDIKEAADQQNLFEQKGRNLARRLRNGFKSRSEQVNLILDHVAGCTYPVILVGDLNDLPFSYTYQKLEDKFENAFTSTGFGIGTTYNGMIPFLRIDNQFYSPHIINTNYQVYDEIGYSDHFPTMGTYVLSKE